MSDGGRGDAPWWSSGADDLDDRDDPFAAHRRARTGGASDGDGGGLGDAHGGPGGGPTGSSTASGADADRDGRDESWDRPWDVPWEDWDDRDPDPPPGAQRSTVEDALDALQALARFVGSRRTGRSGIRPHSREQTCRACPWCIAMRSLGDVRPEVVDHLDEALRHLVAAARAWVEAADSRGAWEPIELDEDPPWSEEPDGG